MIYDAVMAILPEALQKPDTRSAPAPRSAQSRGGSVEILPLFGSLRQRSGPGTTTEGFTRIFRRAIADSNVTAIVIDVDSVGGSIYGTDELSAEIYQARGRKKIVAIANSLCASAAYWIASAADEFHVTPSGEVGSIGVIATHREYSQALVQEGVKTTLVSAGHYKTEGNQYAPLSIEAKAAMQARVNTYYSSFIARVARNRGSTSTRIHQGYGRGRMLTAAEALKAGMVDRVATLDQTLASLGVTGAGRATARAY